MVMQASMFTLITMLSGSNAFELPGPSGQEHEEAGPLYPSQEFPSLSTSASVIWPELPDTEMPMAGLHHTSNISASWPNLVQVLVLQKPLLYAQIT